MPLGFESISHGEVAFGFFNLETDLLLLNDYFFFASDFCGHISRVAEEPLRGNEESLWEIYRIEQPLQIGNLMGAIQGIDETGFIGAVYRLFPFPKDRNQFRQNPEGFKNRPLIENLIRAYAKPKRVSFRIDQEKHRVSIGDYVFSWAGFLELIRYVWLGGMPRWKDSIRPPYVMAMKTKIERSQSELFKGFFLDR